MTRREAELVIKTAAVRREIEAIDEFQRRKDQAGEEAQEEALRRAQDGPAFIRRGSFRVWAEEFAEAYKRNREGL